MNALNAVLLKVTSVVLAPFATLPSQVALIVIALVAGVLAAIAFRYTSNQTGLRRVADQVRASLLAMRLFKDDLRSVFAAQGSLFKASAVRLWYSLPPLAVLIVPFVLLLTQLAMWYEFRPLAPGDKALVEVRIASGAWSEYQNLQLIPPDSMDATKPVRSVYDHSITWRISPQELPAGKEPLTLRFKLDDGDIAEKQVMVSNNGATNELLFVSPRRVGTNFWDRLLYPGEPAFASDSPIQAISINYGSRTNTLCGLAIPWWLTFFVVSILAALALKPVIKVQF
ncbi:MAG: hypothetical protein ACE5I3_03610 [Phycisphaerae bacterium]